MQCVCGRDAVDAGHLDVEQGDVGCAGARRRHDLVPALDLGDHLEVRLQGQQGGHRTADQGLILGD